MKLKDAFLCIDCDEIFVADKTNPSCPSCCSRSYAPISGWITSQDLADRLFALEKGKRPIPARVALAVDGRRVISIKPHALPVFLEEVAYGNHR